MQETIFPHLIKESKITNSVIKIAISLRATIGLRDAPKNFLSHQNLSLFCKVFKGQLISKCPYEKSVSSKIATKIFLDFCPKIFCSLLGATWKLFGLPGDLVSNIIKKKPAGSPHEATKNFRAEIQK